MNRNRPVAATPKLRVSASPCGETLSIGLFLLPGFGLPAFASLNDLLFLLNRAGGRKPVISCNAVSIDGLPVTSSSGRTIPADRSIRERHRYDLIIVLSAVSNYTNKAAAGWLRDQSRHGAMLGAVTSGLWLLAFAGLVGGARCTLHWADVEAFRETYPSVNLSADIYTIEDNLITCAGLGAVADMMFAYFQGRIDQPVLDTVMESLVIDRMRPGAELQRQPGGVRFWNQNKLVVTAMNRIEAEITRRNIVETLSRELHVSSRWLQKLFSRATGSTIKSFQTSFRVDRARQLLAATSVPVAQIAIMTGFSDGAHLSRVFLQHEGKTPSEYRAAAARRTEPDVPRPT